MIAIYSEMIAIYSEMFAIYHRDDRDLPPG